MVGRCNEHARTFEVPSLISKMRVVEIVHRDDQASACQTHPPTPGDELVDGATLVPEVHVDDVDSPQRLLGRIESADVDARRRIDRQHVRMARRDVSNDSVGHDLPVPAQRHPIPHSRNRRRHRWVQHSMHSTSTVARDPAGGSTLGSVEWPDVTTVVFGDGLDGIRRYALLLAHQRQQMGRPTTWFDADDRRWESQHSSIVHAHLTDRLIDAQRVAVDALFAAARARRFRLVVTLHDLPQHGEGEARYRRRCERYREFASLADVVIVNSSSELRDAEHIGLSASVVPHPIFPERRDFSAHVSHDRTLAAAGFVHPGKGIAELVEAIGPVGGTPLGGWRLRLIGSVESRHESYLRAVSRQARDNGLHVEITGPVEARHWSTELRSATIPIAPHLHCSASGSMLSWIGAGRRPIAASSAFSRELATERPDAVDVVADGDWSTAIHRSIASSDEHRCDVGAWRSPQSSVEAFDDIVTATT